MKKLFGKTPGRTIQELEKDFNMAAIRVGSINFEVNQYEEIISKLEQEKANLLTNMKKMSEEGKFLRGKIEEELAQNIKKGQEKHAVN